MGEGGGRGYQNSTDSPKGCLPLPPSYLPCSPCPAVASTEGLFRVPGNKVRVDRLMAAIDRSDWVAVADDHSCYKPHDFASALKHYLAHLPEPLLPGNHLEAYLQAAGQYPAQPIPLCIHIAHPP